MIPNYPYFGLPNYMRYINPNRYINVNQSYNKSNYSTKKSFPPPHSKPTSSFSEKSSLYEARNCKHSNSFQEPSPLFSLLGINLYFDDGLLICIIFFLYSENVNDPYLLFALILLLLN